LISIGAVLFGVLVAIALGFGLLFAMIPLISLLVKFAYWWDDWIERNVGRREDDE
jgi:hypothetical protein